MKIQPFKVEEWMNTYETQARYNIAETCVDSVSLEELFQLTNTNETIFWQNFRKKRLTYGDIEGTPEFRQGVQPVPHIKSRKCCTNTRCSWCKPSCFLFPDRAGGRSNQHHAYLSAAVFYPGVPWGEGENSESFCRQWVSCRTTSIEEPRNGTDPNDLYQ